MAAGVGKTCAMLSLAHEEVKRGKKVLIGVVETHGRAETEKLIRGLKQSKKKEINYRDTLLSEMDLEQILIDKPDLVLVDELAHSNAPGSRHPKRYMDVIEILNAGIDVYSTLNIQHLESRSKLAEMLLGVEIKERVPDSILDRANEVQLVDVEPEQLITRLKDGKIYKREAAERALNSFFKKSNLTFLREIALRLTADRVDHDLNLLPETALKKEDFKRNEKLLVAVSPSPSSADLIRLTRKFAYSLGVDWIALYIETPRNLDQESQEKLNLNLNLARDLGGTVVTTADDDLAQAILREARQNQVSIIVVGKTDESFFKVAQTDLNLIQRLLAESGDLDIWVVNSGRGLKSELKGIVRRFNLVSQFSDYTLPFIVSFASLGIGTFLASYVNKTTIGLLLITSVLAISLKRSLGPTLLTAVLMALGYDFFFIDPKYTFSITETQDWIMILVYFLVATSAGLISSASKLRAKAFEMRERRSRTLFEFSQQLQECKSQTELSLLCIKVMDGVFNAESALLMKSRSSTQNKLEWNPASTWKLDMKALSIAELTLDRKENCGIGTDTLPHAEAYFVPLIAGENCIGVLALKPKISKDTFSYQKGLIRAMTYSLSIALDRERLSLVNEENHLTAESERLQKILFSSFSHELKTPITALRTIFSFDEIKVLPENLRNQITQSLFRLEDIAENLLSMQKLESGTLKLRLDWVDASDLVTQIKNKTLSLKEASRFHFEINGNQTLIFTDEVALEQVLSNLIRNAFIHNDDQVKVQLSFLISESEFQVFVRDNGKGIPNNERAAVFQKFNRGTEATAPGTGLGLSIARSFCELLNGTIVLEDNYPKGLTVKMTFPNQKPNFEK